ncbi:hypothetical protein D920_00710 [Enterococcus faecalis 13-SD-W-01]|nr:hypothetical protein D920_00710 [Enterococcus faecalis 13-SD-W-01]
MSQSGLACAEQSLSIYFVGFILANKAFSCQCFLKIEIDVFLQKNSPTDSSRSARKFYFCH